MATINITTCLGDGFPLVILPKQSTASGLQESMDMDVKITALYMEGKKICLYTGWCHVKLVDGAGIVDGECDQNSSLDTTDIVGNIDIDRMPIILADSTHTQLPSNNLSPRWSDPFDPYTYSLFDTDLQNTYTVPEELTGGITVQHHNTYITQNIYKSAPQPQSPIHFEEREYRNVVKSKGGENLYEEDSESEQLLSDIAKKIRIRNKKKQNSNVVVNSKNEALKQLMSTNTQPASKQRKTILFLGNNSSSGQTIQNISYSDPQIQCSEIQVDHEVVIEDSPSPATQRKKYQCDKCKQIFDKISSFRQHMTGKHTYSKKKKDNKSYHCSECGRNIKSYNKYRAHCLGHGDPDLQCPTCSKVYASNASLKIHMKIHNRKYQCSYCTRSYEVDSSYKIHMRNAHSKFLCEHEGCSFMGNSETELSLHLEDHNSNRNGITDQNGNDQSDRNFEIYDDQNNHKTDRYYEGDQYYQDDHNDINRDQNYQDVRNNFDDHNYRDDLNNNVDLVDDIYEEMIEDDLFLNKYSERDAVQGERDIENSFTVNDNVKGDDFSVASEDAADCERMIEPDSVIAKVMSDKMFLMNPKNAKKHGRHNKSCQDCSKTFDRLSDLKRHLIEHVIKSSLAKTVSSAQGFFNIICEICQTASFSSVDKYKAHLREHAKLTIYQCTFCNKSFSDSSNFSKHKKIHGVSNYQCDLCNRKFNSKIMIARHMEYHNKNKPLKCNICNRTFHFKSMLNKHMKTSHMQKSSYSCRFCDGTFKNFKSKWDHEWEVHNIRKKAIDCKMCNAQFRKNSDLKKHYIDVHYVYTRKLKDSNKRTAMKAAL